jgi:hypothetical protein
VKIIPFAKQSAHIRHYNGSICAHFDPAIRKTDEKEKRKK